MYPDTLLVHNGKKYWSNSDCFSDNPQNPVRAFLHKDYSIGMHTHEFYEINIVLSGYGCHYIEGKKLEVTAGDVFVIPGNISHGYISGKKLDVYHFLVRNDFFDRYRAELEGTKGYKMLFDIEPLLRQTTGENYFLHIDKDELFEVENDIRKIQDAGKCGNYIYMNVLTLALFCGLCIKMFESADENSGNRADMDIIRVMDYIHSNFSDRISVENVAKIANMSKSTLNRHFKRATGITPMEYVIYCRTKKARELIAENTYTKAEIAQRCGFYDTSHMDKYLHQ